MKFKKRRKKNEGEQTGKVDIRRSRKILAVGQACMAISLPTPGFNWRIFVSCGFSTEGTFSSAPGAPQCGCD